MAVNQWDQWMDVTFDQIIAARDRVGPGIRVIARTAPGTCGITEARSKAD